MRFLKLQTIYFKDLAWHDGPKTLLNHIHVVRVYPNIINNEVIGSYVDTVNDHSGYAIKVKETIEEIEVMLSERFI